MVHLNHLPSFLPLQLWASSIRIEILQYRPLLQRFPHPLLRHLQQHFALSYSLQPSIYDASSCSLLVPLYHYDDISDTYFESSLWPPSPSSSEPSCLSWHSVWYRWNYWCFPDCLSWLADQLQIANYHRRWICTDALLFQAGAARRTHCHPPSSWEVDPTSW